MTHVERECVMGLPKNATQAFPGQVEAPSSGSSNTYCGNPTHHRPELSRDLPRGATPHKDEPLFAAQMARDPKGRGGRGRDDRGSHRVGNTQSSPPPPEAPGAAPPEREKPRAHKDEAPRADPPESNPGGSRTGHWEGGGRGGGAREEEGTGRGGKLEGWRR